MPRLLSAVTIGLLTGFLGLAAYFVLDAQTWEENLGLDFLFQQRGARPAPPDPYIVSIDKTSAEALSLSNEPDEWPRRLHGELIRKLQSIGVALIIFDIYFQDARDPDQDKEFATAIQDAGNVFLYAYLQRESNVIASEHEKSQGGISIERILYPTEEIAASAAALATFPLPKVPVKVSQFWTFRPSSGDSPTLVSIALQQLAVKEYAALRYYLPQALAEKAAHLPEQLSLTQVKQNELVLLTREIRTLFKRNTADLGTITAEDILRSAPENDHYDESRLSALLNLYGSQDRHYLNFYGPPRTISTVDYIDILTESDRFSHMKGKVVFVGFSENRQPEQKDSHYTAFSQDDGLDISGVEIMATAYANLLDRSSIRPLHPFTYIALILSFSLIVAILARMFSPLPAVALSLLCMGVYFYTAIQLFTNSALWLPLVVPLLIQSPLILLFSIAWHYRETQRERNRIRSAFGYYLPDSVVDQLSRDTHSPQTQGKRNYGICMATDAEQYTKMAETMNPEALGQLMNDYYAHLFAPVRSRGGVVSDVIGDSMLAVWSCGIADCKVRHQACEAAIEISNQVNDKKNNHQHASLPTRIGLHAGELMIGNVGALDHFEYRAVGDIVNTASRIEGFNKHLGTRILASAEVIKGVEGIQYRNLGYFRLSGKQQAVQLYEILGKFEDMDATELEKYSLFEQGLNDFREENWEKSIRVFTQICEQYPADGPAHFFLLRSRLYQKEAPPQPWDGVVAIDKK